MRCRPRGLQRSVDRGSRRRGIEPRNTQTRNADAVKRGGRQQPADRQGERCGKAAWSKTLSMRGNFMDRNWEIPTLCGERWRAAARREDRKIGGGDGRGWEVGASHSIAEAVERTGYLRGRSMGWRERRLWREGLASRGTRTSKACPGHRAGNTTCPKRSNGCGKEQSRTGK